MRLILIIVFLFSNLLFSNSRSTTNTKDSYSSNIDISLSEVQQVHALNDDLSFLGSIGNVLMLNETTWIVMDSSPAVYLFENYIMKNSYGENGKGPCEFEEISAIDANQKNLYVLDASQAKIITYDIKTGACIEEIGNDNLNGSYFLHKEINSPAFIAMNTSYMSMTAESTKLVHRVFTDESSQALDLTYGQIDAAKTLLNMRSYSLGIQTLQDKLFTYFPLTDELYVLDVNNYSFDSFPLQIDVKKEELEKTGNNLPEMLEIIRGDFQFVSNLLVTDQWIALAVNLGSAREGEDPEMFLQFYSHGGNFLGEISIDNKVIAARNNTLIFTIENTDPNAEFAYAVEYRDVIMN